MWTDLWFLATIGLLAASAVVSVVALRDRARLIGVALLLACAVTAWKFGERQGTVHAEDARRWNGFCAGASIDELLPEGPLDVHDRGAQIRLKIGIDHVLHYCLRDRAVIEECERRTNEVAFAATPEQGVPAVEAVENALAGKGDCTLPASTPPAGPRTP